MLRVSVREVVPTHVVMGALDVFGAESVAGVVREIDWLGAGSGPWPQLEVGRAHWFLVDLRRGSGRRNSYGPIVPGSDYWVVISAVEELGKPTIEMWSEAEPLAQDGLAQPPIDLVTLRQQQGGSLVLVYPQESEQVEARFLDSSARFRVTARVHTVIPPERASSQETEGRLRRGDLTYINLAGDLADGSVWGERSALQQPCWFVLSQRKSLFSSRDNSSGDDFGASAFELVPERSEDEEDWGSRSGSPVLASALWQTAARTGGRLLLRARLDSREHLADAGVTVVSMALPRILAVSSGTVVGSEIHSGRDLLLLGQDVPGDMSDLPGTSTPTFGEECWVVADVGDEADPYLAACCDVAAPAATVPIDSARGARTPPAELQAYRAHGNQALVLCVVEESKDTAIGGLLFGLGRRDAVRCRLRVTEVMWNVPGWPGELRGLAEGMATDVLMVKSERGDIQPGGTYWMVLRGSIHGGKARVVAFENAGSD